MQSSLRVSRLVVVLVTLLLPCATASAQTAGATALGATLQRSAEGAWQSATRFDPSGRVDSRWLAVRGDLSAVAGVQGVRLTDAALSASAAPPPLGALRWSTHAEADHTTFLPGRLLTFGTIESAVSLASAGGYGMWLGAALEHSARLDTSRTRPLLRTGLWRQLGNAVLSVSSESHAMRVGGRTSTVHEITRPDSALDSLTHEYRFFGRTTTVGDSGAASRDIRWADLQARLAWAGGPVSIDSRVGFRPRVDGMPPTMWGRISAATALSPRLSVVADAGRESARLWVGAPASRFISLGLRFAPAALVRGDPPPHIRPATSRFEAQRVDSAECAVTVRVPNARVVELSGDFNGWRPVALRQTRPDVWQATIPLTAGTYRVSIRVDGDRWVTPPGLPAVSDEFNGSVGLLVVP